MRAGEWLQRVTQFDAGSTPATTAHLPCPSQGTCGFGPTSVCIFVLVCVLVPVCVFVLVCVLVLVCFCAYLFHVGAPLTDWIIIHIHITLTSFMLNNAEVCERLNSLLLK